MKIFDDMDDNIVVMDEIIIDHLEISYRKFLHVFGL